MLPSKTVVQVFPSEAPAEAPFYITATLAAARPRRTLKDGDTFAVLDSDGDIVAMPGGPGGIFYRDTRYLSHLALLINEKRPLLLGANIRDDNSALFIDLTNPDHHRRSARRSGKRHCSHSAHDLLVARHGVSKARRAQLQRPDDRPASDNPVRE